MISKHILLISFLNEPEVICFCKQLNGFTYFCQIQIMLYCHLLIHAEIYIYILDTYRCNDNRRMINDRRTNKGRRKTSLTTYLPLNLLQGFERVVQGFACERVLETEHKLHILTSTTYDRHVVSFLFS